jgi:N-dimethylarginine dimethylaminohydrolase
MKYIILLMPLFLTGCFSVPVKMSFPDAPAEMKVACPDLKQVKENAEMSDVLEVVATNYSNYHECKNKVDAWVEWHKQQKQISDSVK